MSFPPLKFPNASQFGGVQLSNKTKKNCLAGLAQHTSQVLPPALDISTLRSVTELSSSSWQTSLRKSWNGDFLVLTPHQQAGDTLMGAGMSSAVAAATHDFARLAALLR